jgi:hypothetical protein
MIQHHKYSLTEIEAMLPWELSVYIELLMSHIEEEHEKQKQQAMRNKGM